MKKPKLAECPFCGRTPSGKRFCSTMQGPALICDHCQTDGPPALDREVVGADEDKYRPLAIKKWNKRALDSESYCRGIAAAAAFVMQFDKYVQHPYRLSDCILGKFNLIGKRKIQKNEQPSAEALSAAIHYYQVCWMGGAQSGIHDRAEALSRFEKAMKAMHSLGPERRVPARRKGQRRTPGGPAFVLGSVMSKERREREKREGAIRRRS